MATKVWEIKDYWALAKVLHSLTKTNNKYKKKGVRLISKYMVIIYRRSLSQTSLTLPTTLIIQRRGLLLIWALNWRMKKPKTVVFFKCLSTNKDRGHHRFLLNSKDLGIILTTRRKHKRLAAKMLWLTKHLRDITKNRLNKNHSTLGLTNSMPIDLRVLLIRKTQLAAICLCIWKVLGWTASMAQISMVTSEGHVEWTTHKWWIGPFLAIDIPMSIILVLGKSKRKIVLTH